MVNGEVALVVGVGPGLGAALGACFAGAGMRVALTARDKDRVAAIVDGIDAPVDTLWSYACDASSEDQVEDLFARVGSEIGAPNVVVFNAGAFVRKGILETEAEEFERCWRIGCFGGFLVGRAAARIMAPRQSGTILFTGATAALRGAAGFHNLAVPKFGLRALAQSMAREFGPQGVHVAHVIIDGQILSERYGDLVKERPEDGLLDPAAIAANYLHLHRQHRSAWSQELDLRPWVEKF